MMSEEKAPNDFPNVIPMGTDNVSNIEPLTFIINSTMTCTMIAALMNVHEKAKMCKYVSQIKQMLLFQKLSENIHHLQC
jgi:hypothetical protein